MGGVLATCVMRGAARGVLPARTDGILFVCQARTVVVGTLHIRFENEAGYAKYPAQGSTTLVLGPPGSGKTLLGLHFLAAGAHLGQPGLHFGFYETPPQLRTKAEQLGLDLGGA